MKTIPIRIPKKDYEEIQRIANKLNINIGSAYKLWKNTQGGGTWKEY